MCHVLWSLVIDRELFTLILDHQLNSMYNSTQLNVQHNLQCNKGNKVAWITCARIIKNNKIQKQKTFFVRPYWWGDNSQDGKNAGHSCGDG